MDRIFAFDPILAQDAMARFVAKKPRSFVVTFAGAKNLNALDDEGVAVATGAKMIAEAYDGIRVTIEVSVGKSQKLKLDKDTLLSNLKKLMGLEGVKKLKVNAEKDGEQDLINFMKEQLQGEETLAFPTKSPDDNYTVRKLFLRKVFSDNLSQLKKLFG